MATNFYPSPLPETRAVIDFSIRVRRLNPIQTLRILFLFVLTKISTTASLQTQDPPYFQHCNHIVPEAFPVSKLSTARQFLRITTGYFPRADSVLNHISGEDDYSRPFTFSPRYVKYTTKKGVYRVEATLNFRRNWAFLNSSLDQYHARGPRIPTQRRASFRLGGFWSPDSGKLCMVGRGFAHTTMPGNFLELRVVFRLHYPRNSTVFTSLVGGILESLDEKDGRSYFSPVSVLGISEMAYEYTLIDKERKDELFRWLRPNVVKANRSLNLKSNGEVCAQLVNMVHKFKLEYNTDCAASNCNPLGKEAGFLPTSLFMHGVHCSRKERMRFLVSFSNSSSYWNYGHFSPITTLVAESEWDKDSNELDVIACRILNFTESLMDASIGDCTIRMNLRFPAFLSIRDRRIALGQLWSKRTTSDPGYFHKISYWHSNIGIKNFLGQKYEYTVTVSARARCATRKTTKNKGEEYPNRYPIHMDFFMTTRDRKGKIARGHATPLSIGEHFYAPYRNHAVYSSSGNQVNGSSYNPLKVSYKLSFTTRQDSEVGYEVIPGKRGDISAEGVYDYETRVLCMIGCRRVGPDHRESTGNDTIDCEIFVNVRFPPLDKKFEEGIRGTIESTRRKTDPIYFEHLELYSNSVSIIEAEKMIRRMDMNIIFVLISDTLACVFVVAQLYHVKKHPNVLPFISIAMVMVLTIGNMIPLLLNFEAMFFEGGNRRNVFPNGTGFLEMNEIIVRVATMVAFLLQSWLLRMIWSSRLQDGSLDGLWVHEKKTVYVSLPLYIGGFLISWLVWHWKNYHHSPALRIYHMGQLVQSRRQYSFWRDLKSYAGFVLDGFLFPQILFNLFSDSGEKALSHFFYIGISTVRLLPYAYDLCRVQSLSWNIDLAYINVGRAMDFYSTGWDFIVPIGILSFVVLIYLQQRFGGRCILRGRLK